MSARALGFVALVFVFTAPGVSQLSDLTLQRLEGAALLGSHSLGLSVNSGCSDTFSADQEVLISVTSPIDGYLYLIYFRSDGEVTMMLFPCRHFWGDLPVFVRAGVTLTIPPSDSRFTLAMTPPFDRQAILGMVIPSEQTDLVAYFRAYDVNQYTYRTGDQEGFASFLAGRIRELRAQGADCAVSVCMYSSAPPSPEPAQLGVRACNVGPEFRCAAAELPAGCLPEGTDLASVPRELLPDTFGPGDDAVLLQAGHYTGAVGEGDWHDWYRIRAMHDEGFVVWFDPGELVVDLFLVHDPCGDVLAQCLSLEEATTILAPCYAGMTCPDLGECFLDGQCRFFIRVVWRGGSGDYRLSLLQGWPEVPSP